MKIRKLNGTTLEGGGQLVRLSVCLSALTGKPIQIHNIRGNRDGGGGLKEQHLSCVKWLAAACDADVQGMVHKSRMLTFTPGKQRDGWWEHTSIENNGKTLQVRETNVVLATSGAITLVLQAILPFLLFAGSEPSASPTHTTDPLARQIHALKITQETLPEPILLTLQGGTNVSNSPSIDYVTQVLLPNYTLLGLPPTTLLNDRKDPRRRFARGWATGHSSIGTASFLIHPLPLGAALPAATCPARGRVVKFSVTVLAPRDLGAYIERRVVHALRERFCAADLQSGGTEVEVVANEDSGHPKRLHLLVVAHTASGFRLGADCLYWGRVEKGARAREEAADRLVEQAVVRMGAELRSGRCVDEWMEDQIVVFQALAKGRSRTVDVQNPESGSLDDDDRREDGEGSISKEASLHTRTVRWVANEILGVEFDSEGACEGAGYIAGSGVP